MRQCIEVCVYNLLYLLAFNHVIDWHHVCISSMHDCKTHSKANRASLSANPFDLREELPMLDQTMQAIKDNDEARRLALENGDYKRFGELVYDQIALLHMRDAEEMAGVN